MLLLVDINAVDFHRKTALHLACKNASILHVRTLLKSGADPNLCDKFGDTPLEDAGTNKQIVVELLQFLYPLRTSELRS